MTIENLIRPNIKALTPYRAARHDYESGVLLDANENSIGSVLTMDGVELNRYPDPFQKALRTLLAELAGVQLENIFVGVGSDEVIDLLIRIFCEPGSDSILIAAPTYGMYRVAAEIQGIQVRQCLLTRDFQIDQNAIQSSANGTTKLIFCCSPNNPTANLLRRDDILALSRSTNAVVVVDEAYIDFSNAESLAAEINRHPNLVVLRTLSKAWGLAGIRLGYAVASPSIVEYLMKVKPPYNINALTSSVALRALRNVERMRQAVHEIVMLREQLAEQLRGLSYIENVYPSDANFILVRCADAKRIYRALAERGIIVRDRSSEPLLENCLRITVGTAEQNALLIDTMKELS
jgi:histidinol-phosphate aminotransferase